MKKLLVILIFWGVCTESPAADIPWETISGSLSNDEFGWNYSCDIGFFNDLLMIDLDIRLAGDTAPQSLLDRWENGNTGPFDMTTWNTMDANGWGDEYQEAIVAHEAGHMFGLWDEYILAEQLIRSPCFY